MEAAFQYVREFQENVLASATISTTPRGGTHLTGFKSQFTQVMNSYAREIGVLMEKDDNFTGRTSATA